MEVENKKARDSARKSYSEEVRSLAMWLRRRDPRVKEQEAAAAAAAAAAELKRKQDAAAKSAAAAAAAAQRTAARATMLKEASQRCIEFRPLFFSHCMFIGRHVRWLIDALLLIQ